MAAGQAAVSCNGISGREDTAPAAAPACAGDVYEKWLWYPRLEPPREVSVQPENKTKPGKDRCHTQKCGFGQNEYEKMLWVGVIRVTCPLGASFS